VDWSFPTRIPKRVGTEEQEQEKHGEYRTELIQLTPAVYQSVLE